MPRQLGLGVRHPRRRPNHHQQEQHHQQQDHAHEGDLSRLEDDADACRLQNTEEGSERFMCVPLI